MSLPNDLMPRRLQFGFDQRLDFLDDDHLLDGPRKARIFSNGTGQESPA